MALDSHEEWHRRYLEQARWTAAIRAYLLKKAGLGKGSLVLEIGCGTGAISTDFDPWRESYHGLDVNYSSIQYAQKLFPAITPVQGDGQFLPIKEGIYDLTFCHFLLMWVPDPEVVLKEMVRVTKPGGWVMAFAEPDYGGRLDYPYELAVLGKYQIQGLRSQGADPFTGRTLAALFQGAGLSSIETGVLGGQWSGPPDWQAWETEWQVLEADLKNLAEGLSHESISTLKKLDRQAYQEGTRTLYVPTFYAVGVVPSL